MRYTHMVKHYSAMKKDEVLSSVARGMELEGVMFSEISQTQEDRIYMFLSIGRHFF